MTYKRMRSGFYLFMVLVLLIGITSCTIGGNITESNLATLPNGSDVNVIFMNDEKLSGELLAVHSSSAIVSVKNYDNDLTVIHENIPLPIVVEIQFSMARDIRASHDNIRIVRNGKLNGDRRDYFSLLSRFPQGISSELMNNLLDAYNQENLIRFSNE